ncbi:MAG: hypothetical protein ABI811_17670 [Acidobacteriota bacterium]
MRTSAQMAGAWLLEGALYDRVLSKEGRKGGFDEIRNNDARFREMRVEGGTLVWPTGADLCPDVPIWGGRPTG